MRLNRLAAGVGGDDRQRAGLHFDDQPADLRLHRWRYLPQANRRCGVLALGQGRRVRKIGLEAERLERDANAVLAGLADVELRGSPLALMSAARPLANAAKAARAKTKARRSMNRSAADRSAGHLQLVAADGGDGELAGGGGRRGRR